MIGATRRWVQRRRTHRSAKGGQRGWEDEPVTYLAVVKNPDLVQPAAGRLVNRVQVHRAVCAQRYVAQTVSKA